MNQEALQHVTESIAKIKNIFDKAAARIDAITPGSKIPATELASDLAKEIGMTGPQLYPTLKFLYDNYPGVDIRKGAHGGIYKLLPGELPSKKVKATDAASTSDNKENK